MSTHQLAKIPLTNTSNSSNSSLDNFQTINLDNSFGKNVNPAQDFDFDAIPDYLIGLQQMSIKDSFLTPSSSTPLTPKTSSIASNASSENFLKLTSDETNFADNLNQNIPQTSQTLTSSYSQPILSSDYSSGAQTVNYFSPSLPTSQSLPQTQTSTPLEPPKGQLSKDFSIRGPKRLYDPRHGMDSSQNVMNTTVESEQTLRSVPPPTLPLSPPLFISPEEIIYNPLEHYSSPTTDTNVEPLYDPQQYNDNNILHTHSVDSHQYSFISSTNNPMISNDVTQNPIITQTYLPTDGVNEYTSEFNAYTPVLYHWFYQKIVENREVWTPFTAFDSYNLEKAYIESSNYGYGVVIATDGGRFDVNIYERLRRPVYWTDGPTIVRRCSWFYKNEGHNRYSPYPEDFSAKLEDSYKDSIINNRWNQRIEFPGQEVIVMHSSQSIYHYQLEHSMPDGWGTALENPIRPRHVHRGAHQIFDDIEEGEPQQIDHLLFLIHGIGEICDFRFRSIVEVVDDFRSISLSLIRTHYKHYSDCGQLGRIELLPISWHSALHGEETGIDERLKLITLQSIPKLRHFSNDTILDALFYTSPLYCQTIVDNVGSEMNRLFALFQSRNPSFRGSVALGGHSLGSLIIFDILAHQSFDYNINNSSNNSSFNEPKTTETDTNSVAFKPTDIKDVETLLQHLGFAEYLSLFQREKLDFETILFLTETELQRLELPLGLQKKLLNFIEDYKQTLNNNTNYHSMNPLTRKSSTQSVNFAFESMGIGFPSIKYPKMDFNPSAFFAMGSPLSMFLTVRGIQTLGHDFQLPTCPAVYNIFHPFDPIAYRIEPMIDPQFKDIKAVLIPHHKGRKRMHLELKESITRMGTEFKQKIFDSIKYTWNSINEFARAHKPVANSEQSQDIDSAVTEMVEHELGRNHQTDDEFENGYGYDPSSNIRIGLLNSGRRIDYVLQEKPIEIFNEYLFAMASHACYWESEDTALLILRELYGQMGFYSSAQQTQPQNTSSQAYDQNYIEKQFDHQLIHTNYN